MLSTQATIEIIVLRTANCKTRKEIKKFHLKLQVSFSNLPVLTHVHANHINPFNQSSDNSQTKTKNPAPAGFSYI
jgi:hypothetical protein